MKIAIVGAGICGLYLAWKLSKKGYQVTVFEKKEKIGKQACSGLFSERILEFIPESQKLIKNKIDSVLIHFPKRTFRIKFSKKFFVMSHFQLDNLVADLAQKAGAKIILNHNCSRFNLEQFQKEYERIIGCDGVNSVVRKILKLPEPFYRLAIQGFISKEDYSTTEASAEVKGEESKLSSSPFAVAREKKEFSSSFVETWPIENGFIWKIPRGDPEGKTSASYGAREIEYGIIGEPKGAKIIFDEFLKKNNINLERIKSGIVPQGFIIPKHSTITLCGDAAGLTKPWSGGGVIWGLLASGIILKNFPDFLKHQKELKRFFLPKIILSRICIAIAYFLGWHFPWFLPKNIKIESDFLL